MVKWIRKESRSKQDDSRKKVLKELWEKWKLLRTGGRYGKDKEEKERNK